MVTGNGHVGGVWLGPNDRAAIGVQGRDVRLVLTGLGNRRNKGSYTVLTHPRSIAHLIGLLTAAVEQAEGKTT